MIDTHAHLGDDAAEVVERARSAGVSRVVDVATTVAGARASLERTERLGDIREADKAGVPKTRISKEVGLSRANLYNHLKGAPADE